MKILLVDDHRIIRNVLVSFLESELSATVAQANNGIEGVRMFESEGFDLVIADINMPKMDGIEMVKEIKNLDSDVKIMLSQ